MKSKEEIEYWLGQVLEELDAEIEHCSGKPTQRLSTLVTILIERRNTLMWVLGEYEK